MDTSHTTEQYCQWWNWCTLNHREKIQLKSPQISIPAICLQPPIPMIGYKYSINHQIPTLVLMPLSVITGLRWQGIYHNFLASYAQLGHAYGNLDDGSHGERSCTWRQYIVQRKLLPSHIWQDTFLPDFLLEALCPTQNPILQWTDAPYLPNASVPLPGNA